ncbi:hypothetical protein [Streptomyces sp. NBC_01727]|uniref:hypothetical protein n=1 Tax=Streptomyces sp. NBC_01727 TaxID=2975924 RepID=UPI002E14C3EC|nr:hypothetical protein OIE76_07325 [Streptomyces sp. NBC_01727]
MDAIRLATCTYQEFAPHMGTPVRTTAGHPRFSLPYQLAGHARLITPTRELLKINAEDAYEFSYRRLLNGNGLENIRRELATIAAASGSDGPLVLLCFDRFDKLRPPNAWCHRRMAATWWTEQTGEEVPELGAKPMTAAKAPPTLFEL